jgi:hypothetical protein
MERALSFRSLPSRHNAQKSSSQTPSPSKKDETPGTGDLEGETPGTGDLEGRGATQTPNLDFAERRTTPCPSKKDETPATSDL